MLSVCCQLSAALHWGPRGLQGLWLVLHLCSWQGLTVIFCILFYTENDNVLYNSRLTFLYFLLHCSMYPIVLYFIIHCTLHCIGHFVLIGMLDIMVLNTVHCTAHYTVAYTELQETLCDFSQVHQD